MEVYGRPSIDAKPDRRPSDAPFTTTKDEWQSRKPLQARAKEPEASLLERVIQVFPFHDPVLTGEKVRLDQF